MTKSTGKYCKRINGNPIESFKAKYVISPNGCWEWIGSISKKGYGQLNLGDSKMVYAHRFSYQYFVGEIPEGIFVCHHCDNRKCVNPFHFFLGTNKDNMQDASKKGRLNTAIHPSQATYDRGCRCRECMDINNFNSKIRKRKWREKRSSQGSSAKNDILASTSGNPQITNADTVNVTPQPEQPVNKVE